MQKTAPSSLDDKNTVTSQGVFYGILGLLGLHALSWVLAHSIANTNLDSYADMLENYAWGQHFAWGSAKHPPFFAWVTGIWFSISPTVDTAYYLLSFLNVALGLLGVYRLAQTLGLSSLALPAALLLCMAFPYSTLAAKFNANSILLSLWPWVAVAWWHSVHQAGRSGWLWSATLGLLSAMAMLSKYYSGVFLLGIFLTACVSHEGRHWFVTPKPWLALLVFGLGLLPHLQWLQAHDFVTLRYISEQGGDSGTDWRQVFKFALAPMAYWLLPWLLSAWLFAPGKPSILQRLIGWPLRLLHCWLPQSWGDTLFWLAMLPWLITLVFGATGFVELSLPWAIPVGFGFSLLWLRNLAAAQANASQMAPRLRRWMIGWCILVVLGSPWYAWYQAKEGANNFYLPRREAAAELLKGWQERQPDLRLRWVGGAWAENALLAFYGDDSIQVVPGVPDQFPATVSPLADWQHQGGMLMCPLGPLDKPLQTDCPQQMQAWLQAHGQSSEPIHLTVASQGWRFPKRISFAYVAFDYLPIRP